MSAPGSELASATPSAPAPSAGADGVEALLAAADRARAEGRPPEVRALCETALHHLDRETSPAVAATLLRWVGETYQDDDRLDAADDCLTVALAVADLSGAGPEVAHTAFLRGRLYWRRGALEEASRALTGARDAALAHGDLVLAARAGQTLAGVLDARGDVERAQDEYVESAARFGAVDAPVERARALRAAARLAAEQERWSDADRLVAEAVAAASAAREPEEELAARADELRFAAVRRELDRTTALAERALALASRCPEGVARGMLAHALGVAAMAAGDPPRAEARLTEAARQASEHGDDALAVDAWTDLSRLRRRSLDLPEALRALNRARCAIVAVRGTPRVPDAERRLERIEQRMLEHARLLGTRLEAEDTVTRGHAERVADLAVALGARCGLDAESSFWLRIAGLLHDVGKREVPESILTKPYALSADEWTLVRRHPGAGAEQLARMEFPALAVAAVDAHHERWDGRGYPRGLAGEAIPQVARILAVAEVFESLTADRSYRRAMSPGDALDAVRLEAGAQLDATVVAALGQVLATRGPASVAVPRAFPSRRPPSAAPTGRTATVPVDDLTGLPLRGAFLDATARALAMHRDSRSPIALLVIDVDHFKLVNDTFGHLQGDEVLRLVAAVLREQVRGDSLVARYAGDEFVALLPGASLAEARAAAERLRAAVQEVSCPLRGGDDHITVTLSIGVAVAPEHGETPESLFASADEALYVVKREGRNGVAAAGDRLRGAPAQPAVERFVGRVDELRRLVRLFEASLHGAPRVAAVIGEAGVGKTTLVRALTPEVRMRGGVLAISRCIEADVRAPYAPWAAVLNGIRALRLVPDREWRELPGIVPALGFGAPPAEPRPGSRHALFEEVTEYLHLAAVVRPLAVVLDDMQWADSASWDLLEHVLATIDRDRVLICLTMRAEGVSGDVLERRRRLSRDERFHELQLARLTAGELQQWVEAILPDPAVRQDLLAFLHARTDGNPFFCLHLLRALLDEGALRFDGVRWEWHPVREVDLPVAVRDLLWRRIHALSPGARTVLASAAVVGRSFDVDLAAAAADGSEDEVLDALDEGVAAAVIEPVSTQRADRFAFTHALLVDTVLETLNARRRRRIHERVARALVARAPHDVADIARHFDAAGVTDEAFRHALRAAERAMGVYAHDEAARFLAIAERHAATPAARADVLARRAEASEAAGRHTEANELCRRALAWFEANGDRARLMTLRRMAERLGALLGRPPRETIAACRVLLSEARSAGLQEERIALLAMISQAHGRLAEARRAERLARQCVHLARALGEPRILGDALVRLGTTLLGSRPAEAIELYEDAHRHFVRHGDRHGQLRCHINIGIAHSRLGAPDAAERSYRVALERGRAARAPDLAGLAALNLGVLYLRDGRHTAAGDRFNEALSLFTSAHSEPYRLGTLYNLAHLAREEGDVARALELYGTSRELARTMGQWDVEVGATAGAGLAALTAGVGGDARMRRQEVRQLLGARAGDWFQGRELVAALDVLLVLHEDSAAGAAHELSRAIDLAERHDRYAAMWLAAECAGALHAAGAGEIRELATRYRPLAERQGFAPLAARLTIG